MGVSHSHRAGGGRMGVSHTHLSPREGVPAPGASRPSGFPGLILLYLKKTQTEPAAGAAWSMAEADDGAAAAWPMAEADN